VHRRLAEECEHAAPNVAPANRGTAAEPEAAEWPEWKPEAAASRAPVEFAAPSPRLARSGAMMIVEHVCCDSMNSRATARAITIYRDLSHVNPGMREH
jgi:hypothetical protein